MPSTVASSFILLFALAATCRLHTAPTTERFTLAFVAQLLLLLLLAIVRTGDFLFRFPQFILKILECYFHYANMCSFHLCFIVCHNAVCCKCRYLIRTQPKAASAVVKSVGKYDLGHKSTYAHTHIHIYVYIQRCW